MTTFASAPRTASPSGVSTRRFTARANPTSAGASLFHARACVSRSRRAVVSGYYCGAGEEMERYNEQARDDDARQYGVWGVDGIRQRSSSFAAMEEDWEDAVRDATASRPLRLARACQPIPIRPFNILRPTLPPFPSPTLLPPSR